jgi:hypothetical protein
VWEYWVDLDGDTVIGHMLSKERNGVTTTYSWDDPVVGQVTGTEAPSGIVYIWTIALDALNNEIVGELISKTDGDVVTTYSWDIPAVDQVTGVEVDSTDPLNPITTTYIWEYSTDAQGNNIIGNMLSKEQGDVIVTYTWDSPVLGQVTGVEVDSTDPLNPVTITFIWEYTVDIIDGSNVIGHMLSKEIAGTDEITTYVWDTLGGTITGTQEDITDPLNPITQIVYVWELVQNAQGEDVFGELQTKTEYDATGTIVVKVTTYTWDSPQPDQVTGVEVDTTDPLNPITTTYIWEYSTDTDGNIVIGHMISKERNGVTTTYSWDDPVAGQVTGTEDPTGIIYVWEIAQDLDGNDIVGRLISTTDGAIVVTYQWDTPIAGRVTGTGMDYTDPFNPVLVVEYVWEMITDANGIDTLGRLVNKREGNIVTTFDWDQPVVGQVTGTEVNSTDPLNPITTIYVWEMTQNANGIDDIGRVISKTVGDIVTTYEWDQPAVGQVRGTEVDLSDPFNPVTLAVYEWEMIQDSRGVDTMGRLLRKIESNGDIVTTYSWDTPIPGQVTGTEVDSTDPLNPITTIYVWEMAQDSNGIDIIGRILTETQGNIVTTYEWNQPQGDQVRATVVDNTDPLNPVTLAIYIWEIAQDANGLDTIGRIVSKTEGAVVTTYEWNQPLIGRVRGTEVDSTDPLNPITTIYVWEMAQDANGIDAIGRLLSKTTGNIVITYEWDIPLPGMVRGTEMDYTEPLNPVLLSEYIWEIIQDSNGIDTMGRMLSKRVGDVLTTFDWDQPVVGQVTGTEVDSTDPLNPITVIYTFDIAQDLNGIDMPGRLLTKTESGGDIVTTYEWDQPAVGQVRGTEVDSTDPLNPVTIVYVWEMTQDSRGVDSIGRLVSATEASGAIVITYSWDDPVAGQVTGTKIDSTDPLNPVTTIYIWEMAQDSMGIDTVGRILSKSENNGDIVTTYVWDDIGGTVTGTEVDSSGATPVTTVYTWEIAQDLNGIDTMGHLIRKEEANGDIVTDYVWDDVAGTVTGTEVDSTNPADPQTTVYVWAITQDANGNDTIGLLQSKTENDGTYYTYEWDLPAVGQVTVAEYASSTDPVPVGTYVYNYTDPNDASTWRLDWIYNLDGTRLDVIGLNIFGRLEEADEYVWNGSAWVVSATYWYYDGIYGDGVIRNWIYQKYDHTTGEGYEYYAYDPLDPTNFNDNGTSDTGDDIGWLSVAWKISTEGEIYGYRNENFDTDNDGALNGHGRLDWMMYDAGDPARPGQITGLYTFPVYYTGAYDHQYYEKHYYYLRAGSTDTWDYYCTYRSNVTGDGGSYHYNGGPAVIVYGEAQTGPSVSWPRSIILDGSVPLNETGDSILPENMDLFYQKLEELKGRTTGEGVTIAMLDSGIDTDKLNIDVAGGYDFAGENRNNGTPDEDYTDVIGHGTATASVVKGEDGEGVAPGADILAVKVLDDSGRTTSSIVADAICYAIDSGARVLSMPFSLFPIYNDVKNAIQYAVERGAILVVAAGNEGTEIDENSLAGQDNVITVGSVDNDGKISLWSNYGDSLDIVAPWDVVTLDETEETEAGTSFSTAYVSGIVALMLSDNPDMTVEEVMQELYMFSVTTDEESEETEIKGVNIDEVLSKQEAERQNRQGFTGYSIKEDVTPNNDVLK